MKKKHNHLLQLKTERLNLIGPEIINVTQLLDYYKKNMDYLKPYIPKQDKKFLTFKFQKQMLNKKIKLFALEKEFSFYLFNKNNENNIIGYFCFSNVVRGSFLSCFLGYNMDRDEINKGYMAEALQCGLEAIFNNKYLHRVEANVMPSNLASIKLLEKLGFICEGLSKKYLKINNKWEDHYHYVFLNNKV